MASSSPVDPTSPYPTHDREHIDSMLDNSTQRLTTNPSRASEAASLTMPLKSIQVIKKSEPVWKQLELHDNGTPFLWADLKTSILTPVITLRTDSADGSIVAGARLTLGTTSADVVVGDPNNEALNFIKVAHGGFFNGSYNFPSTGVGRGWEWRKTHSKELGSSKSSFSDIKLVDSTNGDKLMAAYVKGTISIFVELIDDLEFLVIISALSVEERLLRNRSRTIRSLGIGFGSGNQIGIF